MAELTVLSYRCGKSILHQLDVRTKLISLILISYTVLRADPLELAALTSILILMMINSRMPVKSSLKAFRYFFLLLLLVFSARAFSTPGSILIDLNVIKVSKQGIYDGGLVCWRLLLVILFSMSFVSTTRPSEIKAAVEWFLIPFPFIPAKRIAVMMSLIMRFIPVVFGQVKDTADAQRARCIENRKNPVYRLIKLLIPVIRRTFEDADDLVLAMEARCFSENRTDPMLLSSRKDWTFLFVVICLCIIIII